MLSFIITVTRLGALVERRPNATVIMKGSNFRLAAFRVSHALQTFLVLAARPPEPQPAALPRQSCALDEPMF